MGGFCRQMSGERIRQSPGTAEIPFSDARQRQPILLLNKPLTGVCPLINNLFGT